MSLRLPPLSPRKRGESFLPVHREGYGEGVFHLFLNTLNCYMISNSLRRVTEDSVRDRRVLKVDMFDNGVSCHG